MKKLIYRAAALLMALFVAAGCSFSGNFDEYDDVTYDSVDIWEELEESADDTSESGAASHYPSTNPNNPKATEIDTSESPTVFTTTEDPNSKSEQPPDIALDIHVTTESAEEPTESAPEENYIDEHGSYTTKDDVALYIYTFGHLPDNFITKKEAEALGWSGGSLEPYAPGKCIGGNRFGNYEELLPEKDGRFYTECDIDTLGAEKRGAKRIVFSNDGLIYYTDDHYESFELLYGDEAA